MKNTSITLGSHFDSFIQEQVNSGRYASASEVVRAGLRLLEHEEEKIKFLRQALTEGEQSDGEQSGIEYNLKPASLDIPVYNRMKEYVRSVYNGM